MHPGIAEAVALVVNIRATDVHYDLTVRDCGILTARISDQETENRWVLPRITMSSKARMRELTSLR